MFRARLLQVLRALGLSHFLDRLRYYYAKGQNAKSNRTFQQANPDFQLPPDYLMYESFRLDYAAYQRTGQEAARWIYDHFAHHEPNLVGKTILDWGCGPGRVLRHLPEVFGPEGQYLGADPNPASIKWCNTHLDFIDASLINGQQAHLPYPSDSIDLLYGISIFTHLSAQGHTNWMKELMRILRPGGMALLTTHGPAYCAKLTREEVIRYEQDELIIRGKVQEGHRVFTAYHPTAYMRQLFAPYATVRTYSVGKPKSWGIEQDTWVIQKN